MATKPMGGPNIQNTDEKAAAVCPVQLGRYCPFCRGQKTEEKISKSDEKTSKAGSEQICCRKESDARVDRQRWCAFIWLVVFAFTFGICAIGIFLLGLDAIAHFALSAMIRLALLLCAFSLACTGGAIALNSSRDPQGERHDSDCEDPQSVCRLQFDAKQLGSGSFDVNELTFVQRFIQES